MSVFSDPRDSAATLRTGASADRRHRLSPQADRSTPPAMMYGTNSTVRSGWRITTIHMAVAQASPATRITAASLRMPAPLPALRRPARNLSTESQTEATISSQTSGMNKDGMLLRTKS
ncbi:hypothetical protein D9M72_407960 [compost metagenome]